MHPCRTNTTKQTSTKPPHCIVTFSTRCTHTRRRGHVFADCVTPLWVRESPDTGALQSPAAKGGQMLFLGVSEITEVWKLKFLNRNVDVGKCYSHLVRLCQSIKCHIIHFECKTEQCTLESSIRLKLVHAGMRFSNRFPKVVSFNWLNYVLTVCTGKSHPLLVTCRFAGQSAAS